VPRYMPANDDDPKQPKSPAQGELESFGMDELLRIYDEKISGFAEGDIVRGRVLKVKSAEIIIDFGYKSEGLLPIDEVKNFEGELTVKPGDQIDVFIERLDDPSGYSILSRSKAERVLVWDRLEEAIKADTPVQGRVIDRVKGGLSVDVGGIRAFLPGSLVDVRPVKNLDVLKGKEFDFKVVSADRKRNNVVLSRRAILEVEQEEKKRQTFSQLEEGKVTHGVVKNITDYGVFVDLGGVDGLLHITDISWGRVNHPSEFFNVGDEIEVVVLKFDSSQERVSLGYKQKTSDPWLDVVERYPIGTPVQGRVVSITDYGAFVELEPGVEGLIHISEMSWTRRVHPSKILAIGESVEAAVADVNVGNRRISLSLKALEQNPWKSIAERYPVGSIIEGRVRNLTDFGAFIEVEEGIDGLVHISDMSWNRRLKHPSEVLRKGDSVKARIINIDPSNQRLSLSVREFLPSEWDDFVNDHHVGDEVIGYVSKITDFGLFIRLADGVEGLAHVSELSRDPKHRLDEGHEPGEPVRARIIKLDPVERKIGLSMRDVAPLSEEEREQILAEEAERQQIPPSEETGEESAPAPAPEETTVEESAPAPESAATMTPENPDMPGPPPVAEADASDAAETPETPAADAEEEKERDREE
jgi:small subunit ribosomal protein S1